MKEPFRKLVAMCLCAALCLSAATIPVSATDGGSDAGSELMPTPAPENVLWINEENFPDEKFRAYISDTFDVNDLGYLTTEQVAAITEMDCSNMGISDLTGVGYFAALDYLACSFNNLTELDLSCNIALRVLSCAENKTLRKVNISRCAELDSLSLYNCALTELDVSQNTKLAVLGCAENKLKKLDVSASSKMISLFCEFNELEELILGSSAALDTVSCSSNYLTEIDVSKLSGLVNLHCRDNKLSVIDMSNNPMLQLLECDSQTITVTAEFNNGAHVVNLADVVGRENLNSISSLTGGDFDAETGLTTLLTCDSGTNLTYEYNPSFAVNSPMYLYYGDERMDVTVTVVLPDPTPTPARNPAGSCGGNLAWEFDTVSGTLIITGTGAMTNYYTSYGDPAPWHDYADEITNVILPEGITRIGGAAFWQCTNLESIVIPDSVTEIGPAAFSCTGLKSVAIPAGVKSIIGFDDCTSLKTVTIPEGVETIGAGAFGGCSSLTEITIPSSVSFMGEEAFLGCNSLKAVNFRGDAPTFSHAAFHGVTAAAYYHANNATWTAEVFQLNGSNFDWVAVDEAGNVVPTPEFVPATSGTYGENIAWAFDAATGTLTISGSGEMVEATETFPWNTYRSAIKRVELPEGLTEIGSSAFSRCSGLESITIPNTVYGIGISAFAYTGLKEITIPASVTHFGIGAFYGCSNLKKVFFLGDDTGYGLFAFGGVTATAYYPADNATWTEEVRQGYPDGITWVACESTHTPTPTPTPSNEITLELGSLAGTPVAYVDGVPVAMTTSGEQGTLVLPEGTAAKNIVVYTYNGISEIDPHKQYPTGMYVWMVEKENDRYTARRMEALDNILQYAGSSIRITGKKGIRMITAVPGSMKAALTGNGLSGYKLVEYGTVVAWDSELNGAEPLLGAPGVKSAYAYKRGVADPVFKQANGTVQYTNVLVGFTDDQCIPDLAMRPYVILEDADGETVTLYGGRLSRSIGYIAYQNRNAFTPGSEAYSYIWGIIRHVYGSAYDAEFKG